MFEAGKHIVYGTTGVCRVDAVVPSPFDKNDERLFYLLVPVQMSGNSVIYTPVDNEQVTMRPLMEQEEAEALIGRIPQIGPVEVDAEKHRRDAYRAIIASQDPDGYVSLIKTVRERRSLFFTNHKRLPDMDSEYELNAKKCLYAELGLIFDIPFGEVEAFLNERLAE